jgi:hypothetical protein
VPFSGLPVDAVGGSALFWLVSSEVDGLLASVDWQIALPSGPKVKLWHMIIVTYWRTKNCIILYVKNINMIKIQANNKDKFHSDLTSMHSL